VETHLLPHHYQVGSDLATYPLPSMLADNLAAMQPNGFGRYPRLPTPERRTRAVTDSPTRAKETLSN